MRALFLHRARVARRSLYARVANAWSAWESRDQTRLGRWRAVGTGTVTGCPADPGYHTDPSYTAPEDCIVMRLTWNLP